MEPEDSLPVPLPMEDPERYPGYWVRLGKTLGLAFKRPMEFFERVPNGDGMKTPLGFALVISVPIYLFLCLYPFMIGAMGLMARFGPAPGPEPPFHWIALGCMGGISLLPLFQILAIYISGLIQYICLRVWGVHDPDIPFRQDMRAWIYAHGFLGMAAWTPLGPIAMLGVMVVAGLGFARMHRVPTWKGVAATLTHVGAVLIGAFLTLFLFLVFVSSKAQRNALRTAQFQGVGNLQVLSGMPPETIMTLHIDQARTTLNSLARPGVTPEKAVEQALKTLPTIYAPSKNPYDSDVTAFCSGPPISIGQVGLLPLHDFNDPATRYRFKAGVSIEAWTKEGRVRRFVMFDRR